jgi:tetratricopeptide (TPR) repeat protein
MAQARIEGLEAEARRTLRAASVLGVVFWRGAVLSLVGGLEQTTALDEWLEELCARELVVRRGEGAYAGEVEYAFAQVLVRDAAYAMLTDRDKKLGHRLAASWLEAAGSPDAMALAEHYQRGDEPARAVRFYLRAARQALEGNDFEATVARVALGVAAAAEGGAPEDIVGALHLHAAEAHRWQGRTPEAERAAREAVQRLPRATPAWFSALGELATAFGRLADKARLAEVGRLLLSVAPAPGAELARNTAAVQAIVQLFHLGGGDLGREMLATIFAPMGGAELSDPAVAAAHAVAHMSAAMSGGDHGACMAWAREAVSAFELAGDRRSACMQRVNVGYSAMEIGAYEASERILREALADAEHMGLAVAAMIARQNLGLVLCHRADPGARAMELEAVAAGDAQKLRFFSGAARAYLAIIEAHDGELEAAEATAREAVRLLEVAPPTLVFARGVLADVLRARGKIDEALATAREAIAELERLGSIEEGESRVRLGYATALWATRDEAATRAAFATARARLLERAGNIRDEEQRRSFLENVPENAETLAHARFWLGA